MSYSEYKLIIIIVRSLSKKNKKGAKELLLLNNQPEPNDEILELEIGQIVYFATDIDEACDVVKAEVLEVSEVFQLIQILPLPSDESGLIRVPLWVHPDDISAEEDALFL